MVWRYRTTTTGAETVIREMVDLIVTIGKSKNHGVLVANMVLRMQVMCNYRLKLDSKQGLMKVENE